jgi:hypothetical protein
MGWLGHRGQNKVVAEILERAGLNKQEYLQSGHPDTFFRDGIRREIKGRADTLSAVQRTYLEWMTEQGQPWEILKETHSGAILRLRNLQAYDLYQEYKTTPCDWTKRVLPLGSILRQHNRRGACEIQTMCKMCRRPVWNAVARVRAMGLANIVCKRCTNVGERNPRAILKAEDIPILLNAKACGESCAKLAKAFGVSVSTIGRIMKGQSWAKS